MMGKQRFKGDLKFFVSFDAPPDRVPPQASDVLSSLPGLAAVKAAVISGLQSRGECVSGAPTTPLTALADRIMTVADGDDGGAGGGGDGNSVVTRITELAMAMAALIVGSRGAATTLPSQQPPGDDEDENGGGGGDRGAGGSAAVAGMMARMCGFGGFCGVPWVLGALRAVHPSRRRIRTVHRDLPGWSSHARNHPVLTTHGSPHVHEWFYLQCWCPWCWPTASGNVRVFEATFRILRCISLPAFACPQVKRGPWCRVIGHMTLARIIAATVR
ncbi:hypothetical protein VaNZ11_013996 [Volvox africanus]|uniref:Uncharacterized protein n=1 Tax=Volvox africanus TaxID=51714 RepID=A0ABQ5SIY2_9CHLO|nr:hypothetical protein VaNZ11_013996 [Volvox africanus]